MTLPPAIIDGTPCVLCGNQATDQAHIESRSQRPDLKFDTDNIIPLCRTCHDAHDNRKEFEWARFGNQLILTKPGTGEYLGRVPIKPHDEQWDGQPISDWVAEASIDALDAQCRSMDEKAVLDEFTRYRIAWELHERMRRYGSQWHVLASSILRRSPDTVRQYAYIWQRFAAELMANPHLARVGVNLLRAAASSDNPIETLEYFHDERDAGRSVQSLLAERATCEEHVWRCVRCGQDKAE